MLLLPPCDLTRIDLEKHCDRILLFRTGKAAQRKVLWDIPALTFGFTGVVILYGVNSAANALAQSE